MPTQVMDTRKIKGTTVRIEVNTYSGVFTAYDHDEDVEIASGPILHKVIESTEKRIRQHKRIKIAVPFTAIHNDRYVDAIATGKHARTGAILVWMDDGTEKGVTDTLYAYGSRSVLKPDIPEADYHQLKKLQALQTRIEKKIQSWRQAHTFDLQAAVTAAIAEQTQPTDNSDA